MISLLTVPPQLGVAGSNLAQGGGAGKPDIKELIDNLYAALAEMQTAVGPAQFFCRGVVAANIADLAAFTVAGNDGITYVEGDYLLAPIQTTGSQSGVWRVGAVGSGTAPLTRPTWWAHGAALRDGAIFQIGSEGTTWKHSQWKVTAGLAKVIDTDDPLLYPRVVKGTQALTSASPSIATVSNLFVLTGAQPAVADTTAASAIKAVLTAARGTGSLALTGPNTVTDVIAYTITNW